MHEQTAAPCHDSTKRSPELRRAGKRVIVALLSMGMPRDVVRNIMNEDGKRVTAFVHATLMFRERCSYSVPCQKHLQKYTDECRSFLESMRTELPCDPQQIIEKIGAAALDTKREVARTTNINMMMSSAAA